MRATIKFTAAAASPLDGARGQDASRPPPRFCRKEGAHRSITRRVAEKAGVSVGAVYQYFPDRAATLFRLKTRLRERRWPCLRPPQCIDDLFKARRAASVRSQRQRETQAAADRCRKDAQMGFTLEDDGLDLAARAGAFSALSRSANARTLVTMPKAVNIACICSRVTPGYVFTWSASFSSYSPAVSSTRGAICRPPAASLDWPRASGSRPRSS